MDSSAGLQPWVMSPLGPFIWRMLLTKDQLELMRFDAIDNARKRVEPLTQTIVSSDLENRIDECLTKKAMQKCVKADIEFSTILRWVKESTGITVDNNPDSPDVFDAVRNAMDIINQKYTGVKIYELPFYSYEYDWFSYQGLK